MSYLWLAITMTHMNGVCKDYSKSKVWLFLRHSVDGWPMQIKEQCIRWVCTLMPPVPAKGKQRVQVLQHVCMQQHLSLYPLLTHLQGWARDVNGRDRDVSLPRPRRDRGVWPHQLRRDRDETFRFRDETEMRRLQVSRRDRGVEVHVYCHLTNAV